MTSVDGTVWPDPTALVENQECVDMGQAQACELSSARWRRPQLGEAIAIYQYRSKDGRLLYEKGRWSEPASGEKTFLFRRPDPARPGGRIAGAADERVLYRLPELLAASSSVNTDTQQVLFITEGEKDADGLACRGLVATTNDAGALSEFPDGWLDALRGFRQVVFLEDNDDAVESDADVEPLRPPVLPAMSAS